MDIVGLDLSLSSTGVATPKGTFSLVPKKIVGEERLWWLRENIANSIWDLERKADVVVLEGYSYSSKFHRGEAIAELGGVVKMWLHDNRMPFVVVPPAVLKVYATGKGNATKDEVLVQGVKRSGIEFGSSDAADAWWLRALGMEAYGEPIVEMPAANRKAVRKVAWPSLALERT